jgi:hypothetical protein
MLRVAGGTGTTRENIQDWLQLDEGDPGFQLLTEEDISTVIPVFIYLFMGFRKQEGLEQEDFETMLRAAGETETTQGNIQDWLQLDEGNAGFQLLTEEEIVIVIFYIFLSVLTILLKSPIICFLNVFRDNFFNNVAELLRLS